MGLPGVSNMCISSSGVGWQTRLALISLRAAVCVCVHVLECCLHVLL